MLAAAGVVDPEELFWNAREKSVILAPRAEQLTDFPHRLYSVDLSFSRAEFYSIDPITLPLPKNHLTMDMITRQSLEMLEDNFKKILEYESKFSKEYGKIGQTLDVRKPDRYLITC